MKLAIPNWFVCCEKLKHILYQKKKILKIAILIGEYSKCSSACDERGSPFFPILLPNVNFVLFFLLSHFKKYRQLLLQLWLEERNYMESNKENKMKQPYTKSDNFRYHKICNSNNYMGSNIESHISLSQYVKKSFI